MATIAKYFFTSILFTVSVLFCPKPSFSQQLPIYSGYMFNTLEINPAYAGFRNALQATSVYRKQWTGFENAPTTTFLSVDMPIVGKNVGVGAKIISDRDEITQSLGGELTYSYKVATGYYSTLAFGIQAGVSNLQADFTKVDVIDANDPLFSQNINITRVNVGAGVFFNTDNFFIGLASPNLYRVRSIRLGSSGTPENDFTQRMQVNLNSGYVFTLNDDVRFKPSFLLRGMEGSPLSYDINANLWLTDLLSLGFSYRNKSAVVGILDVKVLRDVRIGYAYDHSISRLQLISKGSHEIVLRYEFSFDRMANSPRYF